MFAVTVADTVLFHIFHTFEHINVGTYRENLITR